jgi:hypothetical protein
MRRSVTFAVALLALIVGGGQARADFIKNYEQWQVLGPDGQAAYAMGMFDVMTVFIDNDQYFAARAMGLRACGVALQLRGNMLVQAINRFYADHPDARNVTPFIAFNSYLERGACSPFINQARKEMGLPLMKAAPEPEAQEE